MTRRAPGKARRKGLTLLRIADMFGDEAAATQWIAKRRWPNGPHCPRCGSFNVQSGIRHRTMTHRCRDCSTGKSRTMFTLRMGTVMEGSKLPYRVWAIAIYLYATNLKGVSSMKLYRELGISRKAAWFLLHRLHRTAEMGQGLFSGPVEVDETCMGGKRADMSNAKRKQLAEEGAGRGSVGKTAVVGAKSRTTKQIRAQVVESTDKPTLRGFVGEHAAPEATVYTDEAAACEGLANHDSVKHSVKEFVRGQVHTNGVESFWSMLKRGYVGLYHKMSPKYLDRYVSGFAGRHNDRDFDTIDQMGGIVDGMAGKRLTCEQLIAPNGLPSGARGS